MRKFPNAMVIMMGFIIVVALLTYIIPTGQYERVLHPELGYEMVVPGSYHFIDSAPISIFKILLAIPEGMADAGEVLALIILSGGCFYVIEKTGALKEGVLYLSSSLVGKESLALLIVSVLFTAGGALNGLQEEIIAMTPILLFLGLQLGYNAYSMVSVSFGSAVVGASFSPMNPFAVAIAQKTAGLTFLSGSGYRLIVLLIAFAVWTFIIIRYANKNKVSVVLTENEAKHRISARSKMILILTAIAFAVMVYGLLKLDWGFNEISADFFLLGILAGLVGRLGLNGTAEAYLEGFKEMIFAGVILGMARGIPIILKEGMVLDTIIYALFTPLQYLPQGLSAIAMMISQSLLHFPVASYSGQAIMTMPVLAPLSDLIGISRQICVLAYQYGAVMMDSVIPTNGGLMAIITIAGISYNNWFRFIIQPLLIMLAIGGSAILLAIIIGYQ